MSEMASSSIRANPRPATPISHDLPDEPHHARYLPANMPIKKPGWELWLPVQAWLQTESHVGKAISIAWAEMVNTAMVAIKVRHPNDRMYLLTESQ